MDKSFEQVYSGLKNNFESLLCESWNQAKQEKRKINKIFLVINCTMVITFIIILSFYLAIMGEIGYYMGMFILLFMFVFPIIDVLAYCLSQIIFSKKRKQYSKLFKNNVINYLLNVFYDDVQYNPELKLSKYVYNEARYENYDIYFSEDYIEAKIDYKYNVKMAEVRTSQSGDHSGIGFYGIFTKIELNKSINTELFIRGIGEIRKVDFREYLKIDNDEFAKHFDVLSRNKIIAMQILTHDFMNMLIDFKKNSQYNFDIKIYNNIIYLRFHTGSMFELKSIEKGGLDENLIKEYFNILKFINDLTMALVKSIEQTDV